MNRLVLIGAGHAHAQVLLNWAKQGAPSLERVLISPQALAPYSGMVPGWLAGHYRFDEIVVDFQSLCRRAGVRWVQDELHSLDPDRRELQLASGARMSFDALSLNVGSTLRPPEGSAARLLSMRPLSDLRVAYEALLEDWQAGKSSATSGRRPFRITAVGGGAAGFESLLGVMARLRALQPDQALSGRLVTRGSEILPGLSKAARKAAMRHLQRQQLEVELGCSWTPQEDVSSDLVLWATGAQAHGWQIDPTRRGTLAVTEQGFIRVGADLRSVSHPCILAVGDCAHWEHGEALPKAGVYAVRMGPVLINNLQAAVARREPALYVPQRQFLVLLATGDKRAIASRGRWGASGAWAWHWKDWIDREFIGRFADPS